MSIVGKQDWINANDVNIVKDFLTMEGEFEYDADTQLQDAALLLDFLDFLRLSGYGILRPKIRELIASYLIGGKH